MAGLNCYEMMKKYLNNFFFFAFFNRSVELVIMTFCSNKGLMRTALDDRSPFHHDDLICLSDGGKTVCDNNGSSSFDECVNSVLYELLAFAVNRRCSLIENENSGIV